jgi:hypothetical protein
MVDAARRLAGRIENRVFEVVFQLTRVTNDDYGQVPKDPPDAEE